MANNLLIPIHPAPKDHYSLKMSPFLVRFFFGFILLFLLTASFLAPQSGVGAAGEIMIIFYIFPQFFFVIFQTALTIILRLTALAHVAGTTMMTELAIALPAINDPSRDRSVVVL